MGDIPQTWTTSEFKASDGYPLKYLIAQQSNALTLTFDKFNVGVTISPPPASQVVQG